MIKKFVHIGYPKNFSTSLQRNFFALHPEIHHLGIGPGIDYADPLTDATFEVYLKSAKQFKYAEVEPKLRDHFAGIFRQAEASGKKCLTASSEHLSFAFANDSIGFEEKMNRLCRLFGSDTHIILIIRNQLDLIRSLYRESVRVGFPGDFSKYAYLLYKYQDRNYCYDMRYDLAYEVLTKYFKPEHIHFLVFEDMRKDGQLVQAAGGKVQLVQALSSVLGVSYLETDFGHFNEALPDSVVLAKSVLNETHRHDLGNMLYETAEKHRMKAYLFHEINLPEAEDQLYEDVRSKRALIAEAGLAPDTGAKVSYAVQQEVATRLKAFYENGNRRLEQLAGLKLPASYFHLNF